MKNEIENALKKHYKNIPPAPNRDGMRQTILHMQKALPAIKSNTLSFWQFIFSQFYFIRKKVWIAQLFIVLACGFALFYLPEEAKTFAIISAATPLIVLTNVFELSRSHTNGTIEIEMSTQYSLKQVTIARLVVLGMVDILCLTILLILSGIQLSVEIYAVILYAFVPFLTTSFGCLLVLNHVKRKECNYYCVAIGLFVTLAIVIATIQYPKLYELAAVWAWGLLFALALVGVFYEINRMLKGCEREQNLLQIKD